ncbi:MAG: peptidoglycan recognition protein family protein [Hyphomonadaceae bacterium]|nr:peptidoglycan recognition protein family protein [Hyphomonadaceae bacterium]
MTDRHPRPCPALVALVYLALLAAPAPAADRSTPPPVIPRAAWGAQPAKTALMQQHMPREIVIHHTGEKRRPQLTLQEKLRKLQKFSQNPGQVGRTPKPPWGDLPYHFYVDADGRIGEGRSLAFAGDSNTRYDTANRIQIAVEGHFDQEQPTPAQLAALDRLVAWLAVRYRVPAAKISGHSDHVAGTDCPGRGLKAHLPALRAHVAGRRP